LRHYAIMKTTVVAFFLITAVIASGADASEEIRSVLGAFNKAMRNPKAELFLAFITSGADYRDGLKSLKGRDALVSLFTSREIWSERTPPILQEESIRFAGPSAAFVDAQLIQYGSTIVKSSVPVVLLLEKDEGVWKISSWRMHLPTCGDPSGYPFAR